MRNGLLIFLWLWVLGSLEAQRAFKPIQPKKGRLALVIGNSAYLGQALPNAANDAQDMAKTLSLLGFEVILKENLTKNQMEEEISAFVKQLSNYKVGLFYFAGHGFLSTQKDNYLMSKGVHRGMTETFAKSHSIALEDVMGSMDEVENTPTKILIVDACRNNPFRSWGRTTQKGLGAMNAPDGMIAFFAASPNEEASENPGQRNGLFTQELLSQLKIPNLSFDELIRKTTNAVKSQNAAQHPYRVGDLSDVFYFNHSPAPARREEPSREEPTKPKTKMFMDLPFAEMAYVEGGSFQMGDTRGEGEPNEKPVHSVTVSSFYMSKYEITQRQWESIMGSNPSSFKDCADCPVESVSWEDVQAFLNKLNARTGGNYRLPTEAEWEFAAGGGINNRTRFGNGRDVLDATEANFNASADCKRSYSMEGEYRIKTVKVGSFRPNELGLYDMTGNVREWCSDWYGKYGRKSQTNPTGATSGADRVLRGGGWYDYPAHSRVAYRDDRGPSYCITCVGFRVVSLP